MNSAELENLAKTGNLIAERPLPGEINNSLERAANLLLDARRAVTLDGRFSLAYDSAFAYARAALRMAGYRTGARYVVFQCLMHTTNISIEDWRVFNDAHTARNRIAYQGDPFSMFADKHTDLAKALMQATGRLAEQVRQSAHTRRKKETATASPPASS